MDRAAYPQAGQAPFPPKDTSPLQHTADYPISSPASASSSSSSWTITGGRRRSAGNTPTSPISDKTNVKVQPPLDFDLSALSLGNDRGTNSPSGEPTSLPRRFAEGESKNPVERVSYVDKARLSIGSSNQGVGRPGAQERASMDSHRPSTGMGAARPAPDARSPLSQRPVSADFTPTASRTYAASSASPNAATYATQQQVAQGDYGYVQPPPQRPPFRGPPPQQPVSYGQYPPHDPRYQQQYPSGYGPSGYPGQGVYDQYGQPYGQEYGQEYYQDPQYQQYPGGAYPPTAIAAGGYEYGYIPRHRPGSVYGPGPQFHHNGGPPGGVNLRPSPSFRGPPPGGRGGPRPMMGHGYPPGAPYGGRPPPMGPPGRINSAAAAAGPPRRRNLTIEVLDDMRQRAKDSNEPSAPFEYAKALIEAAVTFGNDDPDLKRQKKNKEALFLEGLKTIKRLATTGMGMGKPAYPEAQFFLANCYGNGSLGLEIDHDKAFNLYVQASKQSHPAATYRAGVCYELAAGTKRDHNRATLFYRKAAALGDTAAMYKLGMILLKGLLGLQSNPREAITWLKRAAANADEDNPHALHELGLCFEKAGIPSVIPDEAYACELFTQAAGYGYAPSQFKLGHCYEYGTLTCPVDPRRSIAWYTRAAEQGDAESELGLSGWYLTGAEGVLKQSDTEAYLWARRAADKGLARGEYAVGYYSEVGIGVKQDLEESRRWYLRAAAQGNNRAKKRLTDMKKMGAIRRGRHDRARHSGQQEPEDENCKVM